MRSRFVTLLLLVAALPAAANPRLPPEVLLALERAKVPPEALHAVVQDVGGKGSRLTWQQDKPVNPASLTKLLPTYAALDLLGPAWVWVTPVWLQGRIADGVLEGNLIVKGTGDPKLVPERVWLLLRRVQQMGVREIRGDILLDRTAFPSLEQNPADFDGEPLRPYNVRPDALLLGYKSVVMTFTPDAARGVAAVSLEPAMAGVQADATVPLSASPCGDWRGELKADYTDPARIRLSGSYPLACGEKNWPVAYADPRSYNERMLTQMWRDLGGTLTGTVRDGLAPTGVKPSFELVSPALAEVIREINKFSNNVMAQQLFLTLGLTRGRGGTPEASREVVQRWLAERLGRAAEGIVIDNGSGLSRETRVSAQQFARLLQSGFASPVMPELVASLPLSGTDGTLMRSKAPAGRAHLKTGSLRDVAGIAGYAIAPNGRRLVVVGILNHPNANAARPALDALVQWALQEAGGAPPAEPQN